MKNSSESKPNLVHRLINSTLKFAREHVDHQSKLSIRKFKYELPESFLKAVDRARIAAGYDILPRHRHRSVSPSIEQRTSLASSSSSSISPARLDNRDQAKAKISRSSSTNDIDRVLTRKIPFRRTPRQQIPNHHHHHQRRRATTSRPPIFIPSPPRFSMMINPNLMMHRSLRPRAFFPIPIQQRPAMFRFQ